MKTQQQQNAISRSSAETIAGKNGRSFPAPKTEPANVIQRSAIFIGDDPLKGSEDENWDEFWLHLEKEYGYQQAVYASILHDIINEIKSRDDEQTTEWDGKVLMQALLDLQEISGYSPLKELTENQNQEIGKLLAGNDQEKGIPIQPKDILEEGVKDLLNNLSKYAIQELKVSSKQDDVNVDVSSENTHYGIILQRAVADILKVYGAKMTQARILTKDNSAMDNLISANLNHATEKWTNADEPKKKEAAQSAIYWVMTSIPEIMSVVERLHKFHNKSTVGEVVKVYAERIMSLGDQVKDIKTILDQLAEIRLRWGPITYGKNIFIQATSKKIKVDDQWDLYQTLIHEALHAAEHPGFHSYLEKYVPEGLQSTIREGITEYLTFNVWTKVVSEIGDGGGAPASESQELSASKKQLTKMREQLDKKQSDYGFQMQLIAKIVQLLDSGEKRLEAAYFYGDVEKFLPKNLND
jgi:hypothetical protein